MIIMRQSLRTAIRGAAFGLLVLQLAGCSSSEQKAQSYYEHGKELLAAKDYQRAEIELRNAVKYNKNLLPAWQSLAQVEELTHNWNALVPALRTVLELDPKDLTARLKLARLLLAGEAVDDALRLVNDAKEGDNQNPDLLALKAAILLKLKDSEGAVREAEAALKIDPANTGAMIVLAGNAWSRGDAKAALDILNNLPAAQQDEVGVALFKLSILEKTQDLPHAETLLQKLVNLYPKEINFKKELIRLYLSQRRYDDAEKEQRAVVAADPKNSVAQLDLVRLLNTTKGAAAAQQELMALINAGGDVFPYQLALAQLEFTQGKADEAEAMLKKLISDGGTSEHAATAKIALAEIYLRQKKAEPAEKLANEVIGADARRTNALKLRAAIRLDRGQLEGAISDLRQALNDQPRATDLMLMLALAYERSGSIDLAEKEFADGMRVSNFNPTVSLNYVTFLQRRGSAAHAEDVLVDLASRWPNNVEVLSALAQIRLARQEWAGAQEVAEALKRIGTNTTLADELLGAALAGQKKYGEGIVALQSAYASAPSAVQPMYALVSTYVRAGKIDEATAFLQSVLKANPSNAEAYVLLAAVQLNNKTPDLAKKSLMTAIEKQPKKAIGYKALADFYVSQRNDAEALKVARAGLSEVPDSFALGLVLGDVLGRTGDYEGAISENEALLAKDPNSLVAANNVASLLSDHRTDKASLQRAESIAAALHKSPLPQFKDTIGWIDYLQGNYKPALPLLEEAAAGLPNSAMVHYHLAMAYLSAGQADKASEQFKLALAQSPDAGLQEKIYAGQKKLSTQ
jgi:tetratricopeptide (TPR) repeat protein